MAGLPQEFHDKISFHMAQIQACFKDAKITVVIRMPWLTLEGKDGNCVFTDDPYLTKVKAVITKRQNEIAIEKKNQKNGVAHG